MAIRIRLESNLILRHRILEELGKYELGLPASCYQLNLPVGSNRQSLFIVLREEIYDLLTTDSGGDQWEDETHRGWTPQQYLDHGGGQRLARAYRH